MLVANSLVSQPSRNGTHQGFKGLKRSGAPNFFRNEDGTVAVDVLGQRVIGESKGSIEIDDIARLTEHEAGRHGECGPAHVSYHHLLAEHPRGPRYLQRFGEPAALIELNVDDVEIVRALLQLGQIKDALVSGNGNARPLTF